MWSLTENLLFFYDWLCTQETKSYDKQPIPLSFYFHEVIRAGKNQYPNIYTNFHFEKVFSLMETFFAFSKFTERIYCFRYSLALE